MLRVFFIRFLCFIIPENSQIYVITNTNHPNVWYNNTNNRHNFSLNFFTPPKIDLSNNVKINVYGGFQ